MKFLLIICCFVLFQTRPVRGDPSDPALDDYHDRLVSATIYLLQDLSKNVKDVPVVELERRRDLVTLELFYYWYNSKKKNKINYHKGSIINFKAILVVFPKDESGSSFIARYLKPPEQVNRFDFHEAASVPIKKNDFTDVKTFSGIVTEFRNFLKESP